MRKVGDVYKGFVVTKYLPIDELKCTLIELVHENSRACVTHIATDDPENLFSLHFTTIPYSSNGVAHILEHTVLCGSQKYPVKDPFFSMSRRSLHTFMNAFTGSDFTCYPASSQVEADFYNLLEVYLDAVFYPLLQKKSFLQEGHRLELVDPKNPKSALLFKGIVFNEMKGAMSSIDSRLWQSLAEHLTPDLPYAFNSGGDPLEIVSLTHQELLDFHQAYYHPSQCQFYFYGNFPLEGHLDFIEKKVLQKVTKSPSTLSFKDQPRFNSFKIVEDFYPISEEENPENRSIVAFSYLTVKSNYIEEILALHLLDQILMGTDASLLKSKLLETHYAGQIDGYFDTEMSEAGYIIVARGCNPQNIEPLEQVLFDSLKGIVNQKIPVEKIESALHQLEFEKLEISSGGYPFGLVLFFRTILPKMYGAEAEDGLMIHSQFQKLRKKLEDPLYLPNLIQKFFIDNPHYVRLHLKPSKTLLNEENEKEKALLKKLENKLSTEQKKELIQQAKDLAKFQKEQEKTSLDCLPNISIEQVPRPVKDYPLVYQKQSSLDIFFHNCFTNQIVYVDIVFDLPHIDTEDLPYVSLFEALMTDLGCANKTYRQTLDYLQRYTGGVSADISLHIQSHDFRVCKPSFRIKGKALYRNTDKLFSIMKDFLVSPHFNDPKRIKQLILQLYTYLENGFTKHAMQYAVTDSLSSLSSASFTHNQWHGLPFFKLVRDLAKTIDHSLPKLIQKLQTLQSDILNLNQMQLVLSCDEPHFKELEKNNFYDLHELPKKKITPWKGDYPIPPLSSHAYTLALPVAFTSMGFQSVGFSDPNSPYLLISTHLMENLVLHKLIREIGGAYGSGANYSPTSGHFYFFSYRDPHIRSTRKAFETALKDIASGKFTNQDLYEAKLGVIQTLDSPIAPSQRAITAYTWKRTGKTTKLRQAFKDQVLSATRDHIIEATRYLSLEKAILVCFSGKSLITKELDPDFPIFQI